MIDRHPIAKVGVGLLLGALLAPGAYADFEVDLGRGSVTVHVPETYRRGNETPLVILLHGLGASGQIQESYMRFRPLLDEYGFLYAYPDGTRDLFGIRFWNATNACCDFYSSGVDDSGYLRDLIDEIRSRVDVDDDRIYLVGHSNGGFMSYRMACDHADLIAGIASLAGATFDDARDCGATEPVHVLQIHGVSDNLVRFEGGCFGPGACYPGAGESLAQWAGFNGCDPEPEILGYRLDLDVSYPGKDTVVAVAEPCAPGGSVELWAIGKGEHMPVLTNDFSRGVIEFFLDHPKPGASPREDIQGIAAEVPAAEEREAARQEIARGAAVLEALSEGIAD